LENGGGAGQMIFSMIIEFQWSLLTELSEQKSQNIKKYFLTSEQKTESV
jgi:hypothetical protein